MVQGLTRFKETPSQTAGPYVHIGTNPHSIGIRGVGTDDLGSPMVGADAKGERILIEGRVIDGGGEPLRDALVEIWQADADGLYKSPYERRGAADPHFTGWGRQPTDPETGAFRFATIKPGRVPFPDGRPMAPHVTVWIVARGINIGLHTRMYFGDEDAANAVDPLLARIDPKARRDTLIAPRSMLADRPCYRFDIHLQGPSETVFLDI